MKPFLVVVSCSDWCSSLLTNANNYDDETKNMTKTIKIGI